MSQLTMITLDLVNDTTVVDARYRISGNASSSNSGRTASRGESTAAIGATTTSTGSCEGATR